MNKISLNNKLKLDSVKLNLESKILSQLKNYKIDKTVENKNIKNNLGLILFISLFHQILVFDKDLYSSNTDDNYKSPNVFYDKDKKKILRLINRNCLFLNDKEIPILSDDEKEDDIHFLEYFIGKCEYGFYSEIIEILLLNNININFIFNVNMWNKDIEIMKNYIKLKYIVFAYDKNLLDKKEYIDIGDEIKDLEKIINQNKIELNNIKNINNIKNNNEGTIEKVNKMKQSGLSGRFAVNKIESERFENYTLNELLNITKNKETSNELRDIIYKIIFSRIIKK